MNIPTTYDPKIAEEGASARWEKEGCFTPEINRDPNASAFTIVIPPPNITGSLHMGHALQHTLMDILTRYKRMCGYRTLWLPGIDHAGISTQLIVERELKKEGLTRHDLGREKFIERVWEWKKLHGSRITEQMRVEGASCDWNRERFTMDAGLSRAVREAFVRLFEKGLIYRGSRIVNWCPNDQTVLSDLEVEKEPVKKGGKLYYLRYPIKDSPEYLVVATTRPETMLGDTAVAINPKDLRFQHLIGKTLTHPLVDRELPVISDEYVDPQFGTGMVKITPAHDPNDYEIGLRHGLPEVVVINKHARMTEQAGAEFEGLDRYEAREKVVARLDGRGLLEKIDDYEFSISRCERCKTVIEPLISTQWFCRMDHLQQLGLDLMEKENKPQFTPEMPYKKSYIDWLENLRDWTISRQLWWGHQIPAWYTNTGRVIVARTEAEAQKIAGAEEITQDTDVLDTWFSSALWPFSILGWPDETNDLQNFYPTSVLITDRGIIFLWVSRMVMEGLEFTGKHPFDDVIITGTVLDKHGQRMSKTKGNGVDPLDVFAKYGVDATRITLAASGAGTDMRWRDEAVEAYRNFANKIWNASRFCLLNSDGALVQEDLNQDISALPLHERWIISRLNRISKRVNDALNRYQFHEAIQSLYHFFWDDFCDWYIELAKAQITADNADDTSRNRARSRLITILERSLRLLHPFMPFITEDIWRRLPTRSRHGFLHPAYQENSSIEPTIMLTAFPVCNEELIDEKAEQQMDAVIELISRARNIRSEMNIKPSEKINIQVASHNAMLRDLFTTNADQIKRLARASELSVSRVLNSPRASARAALGGGAELAIPLEGLIDFELERQRLEKDKLKLETESSKLDAQLSNPQFIERVQATKIEELRARISDIKARLIIIRQTLEALK